MCPSEKLSIQNIIVDKLNSKEQKLFNKIYYGREKHSVIEISKKTEIESVRHNFEVASYSFEAFKEQCREPRIVKIGLIQHSIVLPTTSFISDQRKAIFKKLEVVIEAAAREGVNILCLQETWAMPFFLCTGEKARWAEFAEDAVNGPSTNFLSLLARKHKMVIISPILEVEDGLWWNTAVVIDENGNFLGKHRKNHIPSVGSFSETAYYAAGDLGHAVFKTRYGNIAINICYGRHQVLNWLMFALNGADIVFNPASTIAEFGESFWNIEARAAAVANHIYTCSINRVGTETFNITINSEDREIKRNYYGSSYVTAPDGSICPSLSSSRDGLLIAKVDLNMCRQIKDHYGFVATARLNMYAKELNERQSK